MKKNSAKGLTQTERAYNAIKRAILDGEIEEGVFLAEGAIMARYHIGRTPYREACNRLHHEGLLQVVPRRGYYVPEISFHSVRDLFEVRLVLENAIAELATSRATNDEIAELERLADAPPGKRDHEPARLIQANTAFHLQLAGITRNRLLVELLKRNLESTERLMYIELRAAGPHKKEFATLHRRIIEALRTRDPEAVRRALWQDITEAQRATLTFGGPMKRPALSGESFNAPQTTPDSGETRSRGKARAQ
jgi:DNA-binding GntR family transcriptional regulator